MAPVPTVSPVTGKKVPDHYVHSSSAFFRDTSGRALLLRGVNLSGGAKAPHNQPSQSQDGFWSEAEAGKGDFVGRPLDLEDGSADIHLARLRSWGFNFLRFVFTWEALEHEGPGKYDTEYMDYVVKVLHKCGEWGFRVFMDPHQDIWSRFSGGSGAPLWTIYACGIDPQHITPTYSALLHNEYPSRESSNPKSFPSMIWATNYTRLFSQTIFTLFFAGKTYAPKCIIDGVNIQDYLQNHFIDAVCELTKRISKEDGLLDRVVIGWDGMNEPGEGYIGIKDLGSVPKDQKLKKGPTPTPFEGMRLGMGEAIEVDDWEFSQMGPKKAGKAILDPKGKKLWLKEEDEASRGGGKWGWKRGIEWKMGTCIWGQHGVWEPSSKALLKPAYFSSFPEETSHKVAFNDDFWKYHWMAYAPRIRQHHPEAIHFIQPPVFSIPPKLPESLLQGRLCTAPHFYDGLTLMTKHWNWFNADALGLLRNKYWTVVQAVKIGEAAIRKCTQDQLAILQKDTKDVYGAYPTLMGEIGCPYDMDDKKAYGFVDGGKGEGDYSSQQKAWDCSMNASDGPNCLNYTLWTYVPDNSHEWGDLWNGEDLSIFSNDDAEKSDIYVDNGPARYGTPRNGSPAERKSVTPSTASSSATLVSSSQDSYTPKNISNGEGVTPRLLLSGSRAIGAISRPYPTKTVGTPTNIDFDIASTTFKLTIKIKAGDVISDDLSTEIFLPFVHYANSLAPYSTNQTSTPSSRDASQVSLLNPTSTTTRSTTPSPASAQTPFTAPQIPLKLDITTTVSHGTTTYSGQYLTWSYPIPKTGEATYTLEVRRNGGAIKRDLGYVQASGGWGDVCPPCCVIA